MDYKTAIKVIKSNYPPENYTMLREALDMAINVFTEIDNNANLSKLMEDDGEILRKALRGEK